MAHIRKSFFQNVGLNPVIWLLTLSDIFTWGLYLVIVAFIGLYLSEKFGESAIEMVGIGTAFFYLARVISQIPIGMITDRIKKDRDDIIFLLAGNLTMGLPYLLLPSITSANSYYILQFIIGFGGAMNLVSWRKLFASNLEEGKAGLAYGTYDSLLSLSMIIYGVLAGIVAGISKQYFDYVMIAVGVLMMTGGIWPLLIFFVQKRKSQNL